MSKSSVPLEYERRLAEFELRELELPRLKRELQDAIQAKNDYLIRTLSREVEEIETAKVDFLLNAAPYLKRYYTTDEVKPEQENHGSTKKGIGAFVTRGVEDRRGELYAEYMTYVENETHPVMLEKCMRESRGETICELCDVALLHDESQSTMICPSCGVSNYTLDLTSKGLTYDQEQTSTSVINFAYKRSNHLAEHLACFQGKESTTIPMEVISAIRTELKKQRITDSKKITAAKVKEILKKLRLQKYYEHTQLITFNLNGIKPPTIDENTEEQFKTLFNDIQRVFNHVCPKNRKNFLSYSYVLRKLSELMNRDDLVPFFPLLKSREKLHQQDLIWKDICNVLKFQFIPSI